MNVIAVDRAITTKAAIRICNTSRRGWIAIFRCFCCLFLCLMTGTNTYAAGSCYQWIFTSITTAAQVYHSSAQETIDSMLAFCNSSNANKSACTRGTCNNSSYLCGPVTAQLTAGSWPAFYVQFSLVAKVQGAPDQNRVSSVFVLGTRTNPDGCYFTAVSPKTLSSSDNGGSCESKAKISTKSLCADPVNPSNGNTYKSEQDIVVGDIVLSRYYNSTDLKQGSLGVGWRSSFSRSIVANTRIASFQPLSDAGTSPSSSYTSESTACTSGFAQIKSQVPNWSTATASFTNGVCNLTQSGTNIGALPIYTTYNYPQYNNTLAESSPPSYDYINDDGQVVRFSVIGGVITAPPSVSLKLVKTASGYTLIDGNDNVQTYDTSGKLLSITSRSGVVQTMSYDSSSRLSSVTDSFGHGLTFSYDTLSRLSSVTDSGLHTIQYAYDTVGRLSTATNTDGGVRTYVYENASFPNALTGLIDENSSRYSTWGYDSQGRAISATEANGAGAATFTYNADGSVTFTDALGAARNFTFGRYGDRNLVKGISGSQCPTCSEPKATTYDLRGFLSGRTDYNNNVTQYTYDDALGLETSRTEASGTARARTITTQWHATFRLPTLISLYNGGTATGTPFKTTSFTYDVNGNQLTKTVTDPATSTSRTSTYTYDTYGRVLTVNGPRTDVSDVTTYTYYTCSTGYQCGQVQTMTDALGHVTTYNTYNVYGQPLTITDPNGLVTTLGYDLRQRLISRTVGVETTGFDYWPTGLLKKVTLPDGSYLQYTYDDAHRLTQIQDADGSKVIYTLDAMGNHTAENLYDPSTALARTHSRVFNSLNQLWKDVSAAGTTAQQSVFGYDANGNQTTINAPLTRNTTNQYDELNRLKQVTDPAGGITQYTYDANENLISVIDPRTLTTSYQYSGLGDLKQLTSPDTGTTTNTFDTGGNLATSSNANSQVATFSYDALNRTTQVAYSDQTITSTYDQGTNGVGHLTTLTDGSGSTSFTYTSQGRLATKTQTVDGIGKVVSYGYNSAGQLTSLTTPSGQVITYSYTNNKLTGIAANGSNVLTSVIYDPFGPARQWAWGNGTYTNRTYDLDGKLTQVDSAGLNTYSFDDAFRITGNTDTSNSANTWSYGYDALDRVNSATSSALTQGWTFDANSNRSTETGTNGSTFTNATTSNRLNSVAGALTRTYSYDNAGNILGDGSRTFTYNAAGRLVTATSSNITTSYAYNALGQRVKTSNSNGTTYSVYDEAGHLLGEYDQSGNLIQEIVWLNDIPVATIRTDQSGGSVGVFYIHTDHLNAPTKVTRPSDNQVIWRWDHDPFGNGTPNQDPDGNGLQLTMNLRFAGQYADQETGLYYNYFRYYDPTTGRYITSDPIGLRGGLNTYAYVKGNPLRYIDPLGLEAEMCHRPIQGFIIPGQHCFIRFNGDNNDTMSFDPNGVHRDPAPEGASCTKPSGPPNQDECIKKEMQKCSNYNFLQNNCCHCAEQALNACFQHIPENQWPNWPINPGPQPNEPVTRPTPVPTPPQSPAPVTPNPGATR